MGFDLKHNIRTNMVQAMTEEFKDLDLTYSIGGQISFDVFPKGWDKTYCLKFIDDKDFDEIHFLVIRHLLVGMIMRFLLVIGLKDTLLYRLMILWNNALNCSCNSYFY